MSCDTTYRNVPGRMQSPGGNLAQRPSCSRQRLRVTGQWYMPCSLKPIGRLCWFAFTSLWLDQEPCGLPVTSPLVTGGTDSTLAVLNQGIVAQETCCPRLEPTPFRIWRTKNAATAYPINGLGCFRRLCLSGEACTRDRRPAPECEPFLERGSYCPGRHPAPRGCGYHGQSGCFTRQRSGLCPATKTNRAFGQARVRIPTTYDSH